MLVAARRKSAVMFVGFVIALIASMANAVDAEDVVVLPAPEGKISPEIKLERTTVSIIGEKVTVQFDIKNTGVKTLKTRLSIYPPIIRWNGFGISHFDNHFPDLAIYSDEHKIYLSENVTAYFEGKNVTTILKKNHIDPLLVGDDAALIPEKSKLAALLPPLVKLGLFEQNGSNFYANWSAQAWYVWTLYSPPKVVAVTKLQYRARPAYDTFSTNSRELRGHLLMHCAEPDQVFQMLASTSGVHPKYLVVERHEIATGFAGLQNSRVVINLDGSTLRGVTPVLALACNGGSSVLGKAGFKTAEVSSQFGRISILVLSVQEQE